MITSGIKKQTNVNFHNLTFFILLLCFRLSRPGIFLLSDECNAGKRFGCAKYPLCMPLVKIIIRTNNISEVNRDFLAYVVCHSVKWVPNLWELSQLGKNFLSWPPAVGKNHNRQNDDKTNSLWCCWTQEAKLLLSCGSQINRIMVRPPRDFSVFHHFLLKLLNPFRILEPRLISAGDHQRLHQCVHLPLETRRNAPMRWGVGKDLTIFN